MSVLDTDSSRAINLVYPYPWIPTGVITLTNGSQTVQDPDRAGWQLAVSLSEKRIVGDLNQDGAEETVVFLQSRPGPQSNFLPGLTQEVVALTAHSDYTFHPAGVLSLDSRLRVRTGRVVNGVLFLSLDVLPDGGVRLVHLALGENGFELARASTLVWASDQVIHVIRRGENLTQIAERFDVSMTELRRANGLGDADVILVGRQLVIPRPRSGGVRHTPRALLSLDQTPRITPLPLKPAAYVVQDEENLAELARILAVSLSDLSAHNGISETAILTPGQVLYVPGIPRDRVIYLTFDDGPTEEWTPAVLDLLDRFHAKATFFVVGSFARLYPELIQREHEAGHAIANHTYYHVRLGEMSQQKVWWELISTQNAIGVDIQAPCLRPPYASLSPRAERQVAEMGYKLVMWDLDSLDWKREDAQEIAASVIDRAYDGAIVLMHDGGDERMATIQALERVLETLSIQGYRFESLCQK